MAVGCISLLNGFGDLETARNKKFKRTSPVNFNIIRKGVKNDRNRSTRNYRLPPRD